MVGAHLGGVLEQERLFALQPQRQLVHRLLVTAPIEAGKSDDGAFNVVGRNHYCAGHKAQDFRRRRRKSKLRRTLSPRSKKIRTASVTAVARMRQPQLMPRAVERKGDVPVPSGASKLAPFTPPRVASRGSAISVSVS